MVLSLFHMRSLSLIYFCVILFPPIRHLTMHRPCPSLTPSLSHCPLHTLSAILFPHIAFSHLCTVPFPRIPLPRGPPRPFLAPRIPLLLADPLIHRSRRGSPFSARDVTPPRTGSPRASPPPWEDLD